GARQVPDRRAVRRADRAPAAGAVAQRARARHRPGPDRRARRERRRQRVPRRGRRRAQVRADRLRAVVPVRDAGRRGARGRRAGAGRVMAFAGWLRDHPLLSLIPFLPLVTVLVLATAEGIARLPEAVWKWGALLGSLVGAALTALLWQRFDPAASGQQMV